MADQPSITPMPDADPTVGAGIQIPVSAVAPETAAPPAPVAVTPSEQPAAVEGPTKGGFFWGTGRRKTAVARVRIRPGTGKFMIHAREADKYFLDIRQRMDIMAPLRVTKTAGRWDVFVNVDGGGQTGQAGAVVLGIARALVKADPTLEAVLRDNKFLTRDARKVERKKPGQPGARKRFQFSKR